ncbi:ATP-binding protein [Streptomyces cyaneofuscatus]|uniref:ATP-binding protein n=1 Tax=Streptomyces cyaneofuscatus TaxID=66883 RepID=UPI0036A072C8
MEWQLSALIEDIRFCVSELAANARLHGVPPGREFAVRLDLADNLVQLEVQDSGGGLPVIQGPDEEGCSGRGLFLVSELASDFGIDHHAVGKTVWAGSKRPAAPLGRGFGSPRRSDEYDRDLEPAR